jgi:hypothetical protein
MIYSSPAPLKEQDAGQSLNGGLPASIQGVPAADYRHVDTCLADPRPQNISSLTRAAVLQKYADKALTPQQFDTLILLRNLASDWCNISYEYRIVRLRDADSCKSLLKKLQARTDSHDEFIARFEKDVLTADCPLNYYLQITSRSSFGKKQKHQKKRPAIQSYDVGSEIDSHLCNFMQKDIADTIMFGTSHDFCLFPPALEACLVQSIYPKTYLTAVPLSDLSTEKKLANYLLNRQRPVYCGDLMLAPHGELFSPTLLRLHDSWHLFVGSATGNVIRENLVTMALLLINKKEARSLTGAGSSNELYDSTLDLMIDKLLDYSKPKLSQSAFDIISSEMTVYLISPSATKARATVESCLENLKSEIVD